MLTLYQSNRAWQSPNLSPFCTKLECYLRMAEIPHEVKIGDPRKAPKGKVPYIDHDGKILGDSSLIIEYLKQRFGDTVDGHLSPEQHALGRLVQRTLEEGTYFVGVYNRWVEEKNFELIRSELFAKMMGPPLLWFIPDLVRKKVLGTLYGQGISRHNRDDVYAMGNEDIAAIGLLLGSKPYLLGDRPTSYDAVLYAFSSAVWETPFARDFAPAPDNVRAHMARMHARYFPDIK